MNSIPSAGSDPGGTSEVVTLEQLRAELGDQIVREHLATARSRITIGEDDLKISEEEGWPIEAVAALRRAVVADEITSSRRPTEEVFADYVLRQQGCIQDLNKAIERWKTEPKAANVVVGAIKARSEIIDRVMSRGQEFGILKRAAKRREIIHKGQSISELPPGKMRDLIKRLLGEFQRLQHAVGPIGPEYKDQIVDVSSEPVTGGKNGDRLDTTERRRRIAGKGVDRAKAARVRTRTNLVRRRKSTTSPDD